MTEYIYGIMDGVSETDFNFSGLNGSRPVYLIAHQSLGCVVSGYSGPEISCLAKEEVVRRLLAYQMVVEHVMRNHTVLPVKFGTVLTSSDEVRRLLIQGQAQFLEALAWLQDKVEVEVAATWDTRQILREIGTEPEIIHARQAILEQGQPTVQEQIQVGQMVRASMDQCRRGYREQMLNFLMSLAVDWQPNPLVSDEMVMNVAFLVEKTNQEEFDGCVRQLDELFDNRINFRIVGPLPPYSFATVEVTRLNPEKIEEARQLLHLGNTFAESDVRKAYRHLAAASHPDHNPGNSVAKVEFAKLRQASELLSAYCQGHCGSDASFLIDIKRSGGEEVEHLNFAEVSV